MDVEYGTASPEKESELLCCEESEGSGEAIHVLSSGDDIRELQWSASIEGTSTDTEPTRRLPGVLPWGSSEESVIQVPLVAGEQDNKYKTPATVDCLSCEEGNRLQHSDSLIATACTEVKISRRNMSSFSAWEEVACTQPDKRDDLPGDTAAVDHEGLAWEIDFSSSSAGKKSKKPVPKFLLREREKKQQSEQLKDVSPSLKTSPPKKARPPPSKAKTTPERNSKSPIPRSLSPKASTRAPTPLNEKIKKSPPLKRSLLPWGDKLKRPLSAQPLKLPSPQNHANRPSSAKSLAVIRREVKTPQSSPISESRTPPSSPRQQSPRTGKNGVHLPRESKSGKQRSAGTGGSRPKMEEPLPSDESSSSVGAHLQAEHEVEGVTESAGCGGTVWEIDLSSFKTGKKASRPPRSKRDSSPVLTRPLQLKQLMKVTLPQSEVSKVPVPTLATVPQEMEQRKVLDLRRWYCMCRPQYSRSCGLSSVVSCWNYLFSTLGSGSLPPITQEEALTVLGFKPPFGEIRFGPFTGNATVMRWFQNLCSHYGVEGQAYYSYKPVGKAKTFGIKPQMALDSLKEGLRDSSTTFVYHCLNHYFCPVGYEEIPKNATDTYKVNLPADVLDTWLLIGDPSRKHPGIHCKKWEDVVTDLTCKLPQCFNIRHTERGVQSRRTKKVGGNLHCIMAFKKLEERMLQTSSGGITLNFSLPQKQHPPENFVDETASENLDSSDSDYPLSQDLSRETPWAEKLKSASEDVEGVDTSWVVVEEVDSLMQTRSFEDDHKDRDSSAALTGTFSKRKKESSKQSSLDVPTSSGVATGQLHVEEVDARMETRSSEIDPDSSAALNHKRKGTFTKRKENGNRDVPTSSTDDGSQVGSPLIPSAYLTAPEIQVTRSDSPDDVASPTPSPSRIKRTGTFTKKRSSLSPTKPGSPQPNPKLELVSNKIANPEEDTSGSLEKKFPSPASEASEEDVDSSVEVTDLPVSPLKRSGTFKKERPSIRPENAEELFVHSHSPVQLSDDELNVDTTLPASPLKRSGTFKKDRPSIRPENTENRTELFVHSHSPQQLSDDDELNVDTTLPASPLKRSGTFRKERPSIRPENTENRTELFVHSHSPQQLSDDDELNVDTTLPASPLKRSGTFRKERPSIRPENTENRTELFVHSHSPQQLSDDDELNIDTTLPASPLKRSGTFRKERPSIRPENAENRTELFVHSHSPQQLSDDDDALNVDTTLPASSPLKRSGTFKKERPSIRPENADDRTELFVHSYSPQQLSDDDEPNVDLDDTLKAEDFFEAQISGDSDSESSSEETSVVRDALSPGGSNLKRSGTFTKKRPFLSDSPVV